MSGADNPEVMQGRLGWEPGDVSQASPGELEPHEKNKEIYGDTEGVNDLDEEFRQSVEKKGVLEPLVITNGKKIISGHRRWLAAKDAGLDSVPVRYTEFDDELAEREALVEFNRQREKTPGQIVNEFDEMFEIERERAKDREKRGGESGGKGSGNVTKPFEDTGAARDKAAEKVNADVSGRTLEKGLEVKEKAESGDEPDEVRETAKNEWEKLQSGDTSFHTAKKNVEKAEAEKEVEEQKEPDEEGEPARIRQQDAVEFMRDIEDADLLIADPPYSTDVENVSEFAEWWLPEAIEVIGSDCAFITIGAYAEEIQAYLNTLDELGVRDRTQVLVWTYRNTLGQTPNSEYKLNWQAILFIQSDPPTELDSPKTSEQWAVQDINAPDGRFGDRHHKWQKPDELINRFIRHTTDEGDFVVDPFVGTGTTVLEAAGLGRKNLGADSDEEMLKIAEDRGCIYE